MEFIVCKLYFKKKILFPIKNGNNISGNTIINNGLIFRDQNEKDKPNRKKKEKLDKRRSKHFREKELGNGP